MNDDSLWLAQTTLAALADLAFACALGALLLNAWLAREQAFATVSPARHGWRRAALSGLSAAIALVVCNFASLWLQAAAMSGAPIAQAGDALWLVATGTHAGIGWSVALAGSVLLLLATCGALSMSLSASRSGLALLAALIVAAGKSAVGHAADAGAFSLAEAVQTLHLLATAAWGGIVIAGAFVSPALDTSLARAFLIRTVARMSRAASVAVAFVVLTGVFNAWRGIGGSPAVLTASTWGHALIVKLLLVAAALAFGALNRWSALPRLSRSASTMDAHTVINVMRVEALMIAGVFVAAAVLSHSVPGSALAG
ncbi:copper resistance D domain-containing protein [Caballeronia temeraria]|uniref:Copper resistance D domain-containing protein n=1 Tax=Caballeronia temeraria TaxID=1777137 RepID=A0A158B4K6_9BURK|nr:CopD family protein [Caballeronia temeraria]SAK65015.1 copper resistance D domain-containing protein [Caballeronia temeraria]